ncbi:hypothetical protein N7E81_15145 [Reichenbachiella carrageenanivorans]|uniref:Holin of 3TMs, for gene-transfer release n=1 Tax=Reichenbachiella carrageenanivorans TaxID=2979869 RepID=A0ABY6D4B1_9BACT|nr:hypothetical protein [Reichenbachiella carrageenanivorans]UXX78695.1 hypothetical protein N7E81_15145 [Reichenbachiella carrageenanivorans]
MKELYHEEQKILSEYVGKVKKKDVNLEDAVGIAMHYKDLLDQSKVITRISDRLQKKLDHANQKIKVQNNEIQKKNGELEITIDQLDKMTMGKKATRILFGVFVILFISEQLFLEPIIDSWAQGNFIGIGVMLIIALMLKFFESKLEDYFTKQSKREILSNQSGTTQQNSTEEKSQFSFLKSKGAA